MSVPLKMPCSREYSSAFTNGFITLKTHMGATGCSVDSRFETAYIAWFSRTHPIILLVGQRQ
jgi:hypothetical protein